MKFARFGLAAVALVVLAALCVWLLGGEGDEPAPAAGATVTATATPAVPAAPTEALAPQAPPALAPAAAGSTEVAAVPATDDELIAERVGTDAAAPPAPLAGPVDDAVAFVKGIARGPDGKGVPRAVVVLEAINEELLGRMPAGMRKMALEQARKAGSDYGWFMPVGQCATDETGRFAIAAPTKKGDPLRLRITHEGFLPIRSRDFPLEQPPGPIDVTLVGGGTIEVTLRTHDGKAPEEPGGSVSVEERDRPAVRSSGLAFEFDAVAGTQLSSWTPLPDGSGTRGTLGPLPAGTHVLRVFGKGYRSGKLDVALSEQETTAVEVTLQAGLTLAGKVVDGGGTPIAGAMVWAYPAPSGGSLWGADPDAMRQLTAQTADDGTFSVRGLDEKGYMLNAHAAGFTQPHRGMPKTHQPGGAPVVITLTRMRSLSGRVLLEGSDAPAGAGITVSADALDGGAWNPGSTTVATDDEGAFKVDVQKGGRYTITARGNGLTTGDRVEVRFPPQGDVTDVIVRVRKGAALALTALDRRTRRPVAGAAVGLRASGAVPWTESDEQRETDAQGAAKLEGLAPGEWTVSVAHAQFAPVTRTVVVKDRDPDPLVIELVPGATLRVRLLDAASAPVTGHMIMLMSKGANLMSMAGPEHMGSTDDDGRCELTSVPPGTYGMHGMAAGGMGGQSMTPLGDVTLAEGETRDLELRLAGKGKVKGQVRLPTGRPLADAQVMVHPPGGDWLSGFGWAQTDAEGRFETETAPGKQVVSTAGAEDRTIEVRAGATIEVTLEVRAGTVAGRLMGRDGQPAAGARVLLRRLDAPDDLFSDMAELQATWSDEPTDELGRFELERVRPGRYRLLATSPGQGCVVGDELVMGQDDARTGLDLLLSPGARLELTLTRADGSPAVGTQVALYHIGLRLPDMLLTGWGGQARTADGQGRVVIEDALPGEYVVGGGSEASGLALAERVSAVAGGATPVSLALRPPGSLVVAGAPGTRVTLTLASGAPASAMSFMGLSIDASGELTIPGLAAGVTLTVRGTTSDGRALGPVTAAAPEGGSARVELR